MANRSTSAADSKALVVKFLDSWERRDLKVIMSCFNDDAVYHNVPVAPITGRAGILAIFEAFLDTFEVLTLETVRIAAEDDLVFAERIDHFRLRNGARFDLPVNGVFEIENGKIQRFSDYFNLPSFEGPSGLKL
jgi:limonene-1,2-epoxide hydrolase